MSIRKQFTGVFKGKVVLEALKEVKSLSELASEHDVHPNQIKHWKSYLEGHIGDLFEDKRRKGDVEQAALVADLYRQIGQLSVELAWFKKKFGFKR